MNEFVSNSTDGKIKNLVDTDMFDDNTMLVVLNAINFDKKWLIPFTSTPFKKNFYSAPDVTANVSLHR